MRAIAAFFLATLVLQFSNAQPVCQAGQVSVTAVTIADRTQANAPTTAVTITFTVPSGLDAGDQVRIATGNLVADASLTVVSNPALLFGSAGFSANVASQVLTLTVQASQTVAAAGSVAVTLTATLGANMPGSPCAIIVSTFRNGPTVVRDRASIGFVTGPLGGQVTVTAFTIDDRTQANAPSRDVVIVFTLPSGLASTDQIRIDTANMITTTQVTVTNNQAAGFFGTPATNTPGANGVVTLTVAALQTAVQNGGEMRVTLVGATLGVATPGSNAITVSTFRGGNSVVRDRASAAFTTGILGGQVAVTAFTIDDRTQANAPSREVVIVFTLPSGLASTDQIRIDTANMITTTQVTVTNNQAAGFFGTPATNTPGANGVVTLTVAALQTAVQNGGEMRVTLVGATLGVATPSSNAITVSTFRGGNSVVRDRASAAFATGILGGQVAVTAFTIADADRFPGALNKQVVIVFTVPSGLASTDQIRIVTANMITTQQVTVTNNQAEGFFGTAPALNTPGANGVVTLTVAALQTAVQNGGEMRVTLAGATLGVATPGSNAITVSTFRGGNSVVRDRASAAFATGSLGGRVTNVVVNFPAAAADRVPGATGKTVTVSFNIQSPLVNGNIVFINYPNNYLNTATGASGVANLGFTDASATQIRLTASGAVGAGLQTVTLSGVTIPGPLSAYFGPSTALCNGIWVSTAHDLRSVERVGTIGFGGQVSAVSLSVAQVDRVPAATNRPITVTFTTQTVLTAGNTVTVTFPNTYITAAPVTAVPATFTVAEAPTATQVVLNVAAGQTIAAGIVTITLTGATLGAKRAMSSTGITVRTNLDAAGTGGHTNIGGQVSGATLALAPALADRLPDAVNKPITVTFTTQTALTAGNTVTITFPDTYITVAPVTAVPATFTAAAAPTATQVVLNVAAGQTIAAGIVTITLTGATLGAKRAAGNSNCNGNFNVETTNDFPGVGNTPQLGGQVSQVSLSVAQVDRVPAATNRPITVTFTTQTALTAGNTVTVTFPNTYITAAPVTAVPNTFTAAPPTANQVVLTVAAGQTIAAGQIVVTLTGATLGAPRAASATQIRVETNFDWANSGSHPAIGGMVTLPVLTIPAAERITALMNRRIIVSFTIASILPSGGKITIMFPASPAPAFVTVVTTGTTANSGLAATQELLERNIILTTTAQIPAGPITVTICGVTLGANMGNTARGVQVTTSMDYTAACSDTGAIGVASPIITDVSMTIPFANRVAGTAQSVVFAFTTSILIPAISAETCPTPVNTITLRVPAGFFANNAPTITAMGLAGYTVTSQTLAANPITIELSGTAALTAGPLTVTISGLTLGVQTPGVDNGVTVAAPLHTTSTGVTSGPIDGYEVTSVAVSGTCQTSSDCRTVTIGINAAGAARTIVPGNTLVISGLPFAGTPDAMSIAVAGSARGTLVTGALIASNTLTLTVNIGGGAWSLGATTTITLTGLTLAAANALTPWTVSVGGSTPMWSRTYVATSSGTTTTTSLTIARAVPSAQDTQATIVFSTTNGIAPNDEIRVNFPVGFFIATPQVTATCGSPTNLYNFVGALGPCGVVDFDSSSSGVGFFTFTYNGPTTAAGAQTLILRGVTLSTTARAATNSFSVVVSSSSCSAGLISTGSISTANLPNAPTASGMNLMISFFAALACTMIVLL